MDSSQPPEHQRKRRAINACSTCRASKVRCDGRRPCQRCKRNDVPCHYSATARGDDSISRIESLEREVSDLKFEMARMSEGINHGTTSSVETMRSPLLPPNPFSVPPLREQGSRPTAVDAGLIDWERARVWYQKSALPLHWNAVRF